MSSQRDYNHVYHLGRIVLQITQDGQHDGIIIDLLPVFTVAFMNGKCIAAIGLDWICGGINVGIMTTSFMQSERRRLELVQKLAADMGVSSKQYALRWGW